MSSGQRRVRRHMQPGNVDAVPGESPRARLARRIGGAVEEFGASNGTLEQTAESLLRYAAMTHLMGDGDRAAFVVSAEEAYDLERRLLKERAKKGGQS